MSSLITLTPATPTAATAFPVTQKFAVEAPTLQRVAWQVVTAAGAVRSSGVVTLGSAGASISATFAAAGDRLEYSDGGFLTPGIAGPSTTAAPQVLTLASAVLGTSGSLLLTGQKSVGAAATIRWDWNGVYQGALEDSAPDGPISIIPWQQPAGIKVGDTVTIYLDGFPQTASATVTGTPPVSSGGSVTSATSSSTTVTSGGSVTSGGTVTSTTSATTSTTSSTVTSGGSATATPTLSMSPTAPGTMAPGANWTTTVTASGLASFSYMVMSKANVAYGMAQTATVGAKGTAQVTASFTATGDYLLCFDAADTSIQTYSDPVTISAPVVNKAPGASSGNLALAQAFVSAVHAAVNIERARITSMTYDGTPLYQSAAYWKYLAATGINLVRIIYPWSPVTFLAGGSGTASGAMPSVAAGSMFANMLAGALLATQNGVRVWFTLQDLSSIEAGDMNATSNAWLAAAAAAIAASGIAPDMIVIDPYNEVEGDNNATVDPVYAAAIAILRAHLPIAGGWLLGWGGANWNSDGDLNGDGSPSTPRAAPPDAQCIASVHHYPNANVPQNGTAAYEADFAGMLANCQQWSAANGGTPVLCMEAGLWNPNDSSYGQNDPGVGAWPESITAMYAAAGGVKPAPWAITDGSDPVSNGGSDASLPTAVAAAFAGVA